MQLFYINFLPKWNYFELLLDLLSRRKKEKCVFIKTSNSEILIGLFFHCKSKYKPGRKGQEWQWEEKNCNYKNPENSSDS